jgi:hypothetical protein
MSEEAIMATRITPTAKNLYDEDFFVWSQKQAELLRDHRFDELDLANLIEEVEDLAGSLTVRQHRRWSGGLGHDHQHPPDPSGVRRRG